MIRRLIACLITCIALAALALPAMAVTLHRGNGAEPDTLDPHKYGLTVELNIHNDLFEGLVSLDAKAKPVPGLALSWTISPDGLVYTFKLRPGVVWSDGEPLTVDDVVAGFRRAVDPKTAAQLVDLIFSVKNARAIAEGKLPVDQLGVRAVDAETVEITLEAPSLIFIQRLAGLPLTVPLPLHVFDKAGDDWVKAGTMVTNGPYVLESWTPQDNVHLVKNPRYWDAANVAIDDVYYYPTADENAALKQFRNGELDLNLGFPTGQYEWLKTNMPGVARLEPASTVTFLAINAKSDKFKDARVRRALSLAIDRETICNRVLATGQIPGYSFTPSISVGWTAPPEDDFSKTPLAERIAEAKKLLADAGYGPGNPLTFRLDYRAGDANKRVIVAVAAMWARIGVIANMQANEVKVHYAKMREGDFEIGDGGWQGTPEPEFFTNLLLTDSETNYGKWSNPEFDRLAHAAMTELDPAKRLDFFQKADRIAMGETAEIVLFYGTHRNLVQPWLKGYEGNPVRQHLTRYMKIER
ncbi:Periplasmic oligopeptide-binding protein [Alphaproteobacteria bacterium SO-S41]|nr:Periplasmic oligopeptide-binding protein [Alphaproteobacteria bacterium SO-S41]